MQTVSQNRLASPSMLGMVDGALMGMVLAKWLGVVGSLPKSLWAISFALLTLGLVYIIASLIPGGFVKTRLVLIGIVVGHLVGSLANIVAYQMSVFQDASFFFTGTTADASWSDVGLLGAAVLVSLPVLFYLLPQLTGFYLSEDLLRSQGKPVTQIKLLAVLVASVLSAVAISVLGKISFVGLIVPNMVYLIGAQKIWQQFLLTAECGLLLMVVADVLSKLIRYPYETPISFVISLIGLPFFFWLIRKQGVSRV